MMSDSVMNQSAACSHLNCKKLLTFLIAFVELTKSLCRHFVNVCLMDRDCISAIGCAWCERQKHGLASVKHPYCADQRRCFGGVEEAVSPYGDEIRGIAKSLQLS